MSALALAAYAILTRLPAPWRLQADVAERLLRDTFAALPGAAGPSWR